MSDRDHLIAMLEKAGRGYEMREGCDVVLPGSIFIFHIDGSIKEVWSTREFYDEGLG